MRLRPPPIGEGTRRADPQSRRRSMPARAPVLTMRRSHNAPIPHVGAPLSAAPAHDMRRRREHSQNGGGSTSHPRRQESAALSIPRRKPPNLAAGRHIGDRSAPLPAIGRLIGRKSGPDCTRRDFIGLRCALFEAFRALSDVNFAQVSCNSRKAPTPPPNAHRDHETRQHFYSKI